jgi:hypothetical protein
MMMTREDIGAKAKQILDDRERMQAHVELCLSAGLCPRCGGQMKESKRTWWEVLLCLGLDLKCCSSCSSFARTIYVGKGCVVYRFYAPCP